MLSPKQTPLLQIIGFLLLLPVWQQSHADDLATDDRSDRAALTRATLELQRDLLLSQEKTPTKEGNNPAISLIANARPEDTALSQPPSSQFTSMAVLMTADKQDRPGKERDQGQLFLADDFTRLGLFDDAIKIYARLTSQTRTSQAIYDIAWLELAKLYIQQGHTEAAFNALAKIKGELDETQTADYQAAKARVLLTNGDINQTITTLERISDDSTWALYQIFNIGVELIKQQQKSGALILHKIARLKNSDNPEIQAIRDQANLALGFSLLKLNRSTQARNYLEKVRLNSHLSDIALLGMGWSYSIEDNYEQALVFWLELQNRPNRSAYGYEAMLAVPYALSKANAYQQAIQYYKAAQQHINTDSDDLNEARKIINSYLFKTLISAAPEEETGWLDNWRKNPEASDKRSLPLLLDNPEFEATLREYRALLQLNIHIRSLSAVIEHLKTATNLSPSEDEIAQFHLRIQQLTQQTSVAIDRQLAILKQQALNTLDRYQVQLSTYSVEIKSGIAQTIESSLFKVEEGR